MGLFLGKVWFASVDFVVAIHRLMLLQTPRRRRVTRVQTHLHLQVPWYSELGGDPLLFLGTQHTRALEHSGISYLGIRHILRNSCIITPCRMTSCIFWDISQEVSQCGHCALLCVPSARMYLNTWQPIVIPAS